MRAMSRGARGRFESREPDRRSLGGKFARAPEFIALIAVPVGAALALLAIATDSARRVDSDLRLIAPSRAIAGETLPLRALLYADLLRPEGARLVGGRVDVALRARDGRTIARSALRPSFGRTLDGALAVPATAAGRATLTARARIGARDEVVEREVTIAAAMPASPAHARALPPLQRLSMLPVQAEERAGVAVASDALDVRVTQGACVPEQPCELLVYAGLPAPVRVRVAGSASATPDAQSAQGSAPTGDVARLVVTTHGPEAQLTLIAAAGGADVASRRVRLPVALGASALAPLPRVLDAPASPAIALAGEERGCIVDAFRERRWSRTGSLRECRGREPLPFAALTPGLWQLQVRRDPFTAESAAVFGCYVREASEDRRAVLSRVAEAALEDDPSDRLAHAVRADPERHLASYDAVTAYLLAGLDAAIVDLPEPLSSYPGALARSHAERTRLRGLCLGVLALCALTLGLMVAQRGLHAAEVASGLMRAAGEAPERLGRQRARMVLRTLAVVTSLLLAFAAIALYMVVRSRAP
jgi:hypothetical protein